jgi:hypothetical protein
MASRIMSRTSAVPAGTTSCIKTNLYGSCGFETENSSYLHVWGLLRNCIWFLLNVCICTLIGPNLNIHHCESQKTYGREDIRLHSEIL